MPATAELMRLPILAPRFRKEINSASSRLRPQHDYAKRAAPPQQDKFLPALTKFVLFDKFCLGADKSPTTAPRACPISRHINGPHVR